MMFLERTARRLAAHEKRYRALFDNSVVGIFHAEDDGRLVATNGTLNELVAEGRSLLGRNVRDLFARPREADWLFEQAGDGVAVHSAQWKADDGKPLEVRIYAGPPEESGRLEGVVVDATRIEHLERHLDQVQRAEVLGQLAGGVAHDLNNVLTVILASADMLKQGNAPAERTADLLDGIREAGQQGAGLTRQLLTFTRRHPTSRQTFELGPRVSQVTRMLRASMPDGVELECRAEPETTIEADPTLVEQLVMNLVLNARDAIAGEGRIRVSVTRDAANERVVLEVRDDGVGMDAATLRQAFEPFFSTKEQGTGLGLAVVQRVVSQSSATLDVESEPDEGTVFRITFSAAEAAPEATSQEPEPGSMNRRRARVLLVEDRDDVRRVMAETLSDAGFDVVAPESPTAALAGLGDGARCDVLVTDVRMPEHSGPEVAAALRARAPRTPVLFVSGFSDAAQLSSELDQPGTRFLSKPFPARALVESVRELLDDARRTGAETRSG
jgi:PAS domain S-box-containing protein